MSAVDKYWIVYEDKYGITHADCQDIEDVDEFYEYAMHLQELGFTNIRVFDAIHTREPIMRIGDD